MSLIYGDLHIHLGRTSEGRPVKITASPELTLENIPIVARDHKGLNLIGLVDGACGGVLADLEVLIDQGEMSLLPGGGYSWQGLTVFFGSEVELTRVETGREAHFLAFFPSYSAIAGYSRGLRPFLTNPNLSTQRLRLTPDAWLALVKKHHGSAIAAHAFTPHKGVYGNCVTKLGEMFSEPHKFSALELGLSANTHMAQSIKDTHSYAYIANSDAHSLSSIAREFTVYDLPQLDFSNWEKSLRVENGGIVATHGLQPLLGKYYRSFCPRCDYLATDATPTFMCPSCSATMVFGVWDRILDISDWNDNGENRPPYRSHVPLRMLIGVGPKTYFRMIQSLGTEIDILYNVSLESIATLVGNSIATQIRMLREGCLPIELGGGGNYGRVAKNFER